MQVNENSVPFKVGLFAFATICVLAFLITWKSGIVVKVQGYELVGRFNNVGGLLETSDVRYRGYAVGRVDRIIQNGDYIDVVVKIDRKIKVPAGSTMRIEFDGLIGSKYVGILASEDNGRYLAPGAVLPGAVTLGLVDFVDTGTQTLEEAKQILASIRAVVADPAVGRSLKGALSNFEDISIQFKKLIPELTRTITDLDKVAGHVNTMFADGQLNGNVQATAAQINKLTADLQVIAGNLKEVTNAPGTTTNMKEIIEKLNKITTDVNEILSDKEIKKDLKSTLKATRTLSENFSEVKIQSAITLLNSDFKPAATGTNSWTGRLSTQFRMNKMSGFSLGVGETSSGTNLLQLTRDQGLIGDLDLQLGFFYARPGMGLKYTAFDHLQLFASVYDLNQYYTSYGTRLLVTDSWLLQASSEADNNGQRFSYAGLGYQF